MSVGNSKGTSEKKIQKTFSKLPSRNPPRGPAKILQKFLLKLSRSSFWEYPGISKKSLNKNSGFLGGGEVQFKFLYEFLQELLKLFQKQSPEKKLKQPTEDILWNLQKKSLKEGFERILANIPGEP